MIPFLHNSTVHSQFVLFLLQFHGQEEEGGEENRNLCFLLSLIIKNSRGSRHSQSPLYQKRKIYQMFGKIKFIIKSKRYPQIRWFVLIWRDTTILIILNITIKFSNFLYRFLFKLIHIVEAELPHVCFRLIDIQKSFVFLDQSKV